MTTKRLTGLYTALVTPMNKDGSVDFGALNALVDFQLASGIDGLVPCGTTGEASTLTPIEREEIVRRIAKQVAGKIPVVACTGSNSTENTIEQQKRAKDAGADLALIVTPYYNKPTPEGLYRHYHAIAEAVDLPIILYNVPSRTGCDMRPETIARLAKIPRIVGVKEATGSLDRISVLLTATNEAFSVLSGDDESACAFCLMGGHGLISVSSNFIPKEMRTLIWAAIQGDVVQARCQQQKLQAVFAAMFYESNPIPVKTALSMRGQIQPYFRLPLCEMNSTRAEEMRGVLQNAGLLD